MNFINNFFQNLIVNNNSFQVLNQLEFTNSSNQIPKNEVKSNQNVNKTNSSSVNKNVTNSNQATKQNVTKTNTVVTNNVTKTVQIMQNNWKIVIPSIDLEAGIEEGTSSEVMNKYVGHFENTSRWNGNVALAAHNRGYPVNYFSNLKNMKKGDIIEYYWNGEKRIYQVEIITKIKDTDWTYLETTTDNRITLITCVENEPEYRRCIQATEISM